MSEDTTPKLRLKPKLAAEPGPAPEPPAAGGIPDTSPSTPPAAPVVEAPTVRLKPRLSAPPIQQEAAPASAPVPASAEMPAPPATPEAIAPEAEAKPAQKFSLRPKTASTAPILAPADLVAAPVPAGKSAPTPAEGLPAVLNAPSPVVAATADGQGVPAEISAMNQAAAPFPPPGLGKFPPPPGSRPSTPAAEMDASVSNPANIKRKPAAGSKKKTFILLGGGAAALLVLGAAAFFLLRPKDVPPPPPRPKPAAEPVVEKPVEPVPEPVVEAVAETPVEPVAKEPVAKEPVAPEPVAPAPVVIVPPPVPSTVFKAWVENLKISGVRAGANPRVFIGGTSYVSGDLVNPQLGISFDHYNAETRMLVFKDKTGAKVERRN